MSRNPRSPYRFGLGGILGFAFEDTLTRPIRLAQEFTFVRCHGLPRASSPHGLTAPAGCRLTTSPTACSCLWLAVATNSPREGLTPPIQCPCQAHLRPSAHPRGLSHPDCRSVLFDVASERRQRLVETPGF